MKRIATIGAVITAFAVAPSVAAASGGNFAAQVKPQLRAQVIGAQVASAQRIQAAIAVERYRVQLAHTKKWTALPAPIR
jgi:hypothetical protein